MSKPLLEEITRYICGLDPDSQVQLLLSYSLGRVLMKESARGKRWRDVAAAVDGRHIADWLRAAVANSEKWTSNVDELGRPKKLMKFGDVEQIAAEADKAMKKANQLRVRQVSGNEQFVMDVDNGMHVVRLLTPEALDYESSQMQHCVGNGGYDKALLENRNHFFSLRSGSGKPHVTINIDVESGWVEEMKGKQNSHPAAEYISALKPFFVSRPELRFLRDTGLVFDIHRNLVDVRAIPDGTVIGGHLEIVGGEVNLPESFEVRGDLEIRSVKKLNLPKRLRVGGTLSVEHCNVSGRIEDLHVEGWSAYFERVVHDGPGFVSRIKAKHLSFNGTGMTELPAMEMESLALENMPIKDLSAIALYENLYLLRLSALPYVTELPPITGLERLELSGLKIGDFGHMPQVDFLHFSDMRIERLPRHVRVDRELIFRKCEIVTMPERFTVGRLRFDDMREPDLSGVIMAVPALRQEHAPSPV